MDQNFDPMQHVRFRGKSLAQLSPDELREALAQALRQVKRLEDATGLRSNGNGEIGYEPPYWRL